MLAPSSQRSCLLLLLAHVVVLGMAGDHPAYAGGPLLVGGPTVGIEGTAFRWDSSNPAFYTTDQGGLGTLDNTSASNFVREAFDIWEAIPTANLTYQRTTTPADLGMDVTGNNVLSFLNSFGDCAQASNFTSAIMYDTDGSITDEILGSGASDIVLGFASPVCINGSAGLFTRGSAVLNGKFTDGQPNPDDLSLNKFKEVIVHELGHMSGLDHSQINLEVLDPAQRTPDNLFGLPLMFPFLLSGTLARVDQGFPALAIDDEVAFSNLYPTAGFGSNFGTIEGKILFSDAETHVQGVNVIARQVDNPATTEDESRRFAVSVVSGFLFTGNPGQSVTGTNPGDPFGSRDPTLIGFYEISGLPPGDYTVEVESIHRGFDDGSSVGPLDPPIDSPGPGEFWNVAESDTDIPGPTGDISIIPVPPVSVGGRVTSIDIILNGTPPRFDQFEVP